MSYTRNSVKLLPIIENFENKVVLYTEFDGNFVVGDKLYVMVIDNLSSDYELDSFKYSSGKTLYNMIGYELYQKEGNKLILNINYTELNITSLTSNNCYISRIYIKSGSISRGIINGSLLYNVEVRPINTLNLIIMDTTKQAKNAL
jgi:hypothetical protein